MAATRIHSGGALLVSALIVAGIMACAPRNDVPPETPVDVTTLAPCFHEDGASPGPNGEPQGYPCVWDGATSGEGPGAGQYTGKRWLVYYRAYCPVTWVQPAEGIECFDVRAWEYASDPT